MLLGITVLATFMAISSTPAATFLFPNTHWDEPLLLKDPVERIVAHTFDQVEIALHNLDERMREKRFYLAGYVCYEVGALFNGISLPTVRTGWPLLDFYVFDKPAVDLPQCAETGTAVFNFSQLLGWSEYEEGIRKIHDFLKSGDTYQVNYTFQNMCNSTGDVFTLFEKLRAAQKSNYSAFADVPEGNILSLSPELFFSKIENTIVTKPMKGTLPLGMTHIPQELQLKLSAENLMIVDLLRNDLARVARPDSVRVTELMAVEQYPTLQQIVSTIEGQVDSDIAFSHLLKTLFPCGSITGAPKRRTMEIISALETHPRGLYSGTIGYITPLGDMQFNVAIRTLWGAENLWSYGLGGGIVYDSKAKDEFEEALLKARFLKTSNGDFSIFETMRLTTTGEIPLLNAHLERLQRSARYFGFSWYEDVIRGELQELQVPSGGEQRVRLDLYEDGKLKIQKSEISRAPDVVRLRVSGIQTTSNDIFLKNKTSMRDTYEAEWKQAQAEGFYDVVFTNEKSEVTEASRANLFVRIRGEWFTPPVECGLLPGIERGIQIKLKKAQEKVLFVSDIAGAEEVMLTNALRGCVRAVVEL